MIKRFEETGKLRVKHGRGYKHVTPVLVDAVKTGVDAKSQTSDAQTQAVSRQSGCSYRTVQKVLRSIMHFSPFKIPHILKLLNRDSQHRFLFTVSFLLNRMIDDLS
ncbi:hypothetical protein TNCT_550681 [Trichonephila clavata]|uniref:Uncharacterized protein n=1 Tax=Trichonephila clavata TaxID=2740835 RepID=A0A8X6KZ58_TRICU|nr:hypothetical protein TNCT_550681 [Trichonephila clavata]